jgi:hypothetical protein
MLWLIIQSKMHIYNLVQDRDQWRALENTVMKLLFPYAVGKFLSSFTIGGFSGRTQLYGVIYM